MDKNTWIGFLLIAAIIVGFTLLSRPSKEELAERQRIQDSISLVRMAEAEAQRISDSLKSQLDTAIAPTPAKAEEQQARIEAVYGSFADAAQGTEKLVKLENKHLRLTLSNHGGTIQRAELLDYHAAGDSVNPLCLFRGNEAELSFTLITANNRILLSLSFSMSPPTNMYCN